MKFMISVDLEGLACVVGEPNKVLNDSRDYGFACRQAVREANAAAAALFDGGAEEVVILDGHGGSLNLHYEDLDRRCKIVLGVDVEQSWPTLDSTFSGVLLIGYHPMDNTIHGVLAHSYSSVNIQWIKIDGREVGEMAINAALAGERGVPLIFTASDDKGVAEAKSFFPWIETVETKIGLGRNVALSKHPSQVVDEIYDGVRKAVNRIGEMKIFKYEKPFELQIRHKRMEYAQNFVNRKIGWKFVDAYTVEKHFNKLSDYI